MRGAKENGIPSEKARQLFDLMEKFGGYGFNKSHSAAYALIAFQTAYLKTHYPLEFLAALLTSEMHSTDGVVKYIAECRHHSIPILPPDIFKSGKSFIVEGSGIRFGLVAVKNVGENAIDAILEARSQHELSSLFTFCEHVDLKKVNKRVIESLIKSGAFDQTGDHRSQMVAALEEAIEFGQRLQREKNNPQLGLFGSGDSQPSINVPVMPPIEEWDEKQRLAYEKEALGFYISGHPLNRYQALLEKYTNYNALNVSDALDGSLVRIGGIVTQIKTIQTKKGDLMAFVSIEDMHGSIEVTVFSSAFATYSELLFEDNLILIRGRAQKDEQTVKILADTVIPLEKAEEIWTASIHIRLDISRTDKQILQKLQTIFKDHRGSCPGFLHMTDSQRTETVVALPDDMKLRAGAALNRAVKEILGYNAIETVCKQSDASATSTDVNKSRFRRSNHGRHP